MPLRLNAGLSQKVADNNYGSRGASVNVELELESGLIAEPAKLQERIRQLFSLVRTSLAEELNRANGHATANGNGAAPNAGTGNGNGSNGNPPAPSPRLATQSQVKAIFAITHNQNLDVKQLLQDRFRVNRPDDLTLKQASQLIDELKRAQQQGG